MLAKKKEKDVIDRMLDQIDFHGMTAEELAGEIQKRGFKKVFLVSDKASFLTGEIIQVNGGQDFL